MKTLQHERWNVTGQGGTFSAKPHFRRPASYYFLYNYGEGTRNGHHYEYISSPPTCIRVHPTFAWLSLTTDLDTTVLYYLLAMTSFGKSNKTHRSWLPMSGC